MLTKGRIEQRGLIAADDAEKVRDLVHAGHTGQVADFVRAMAADDRQRLVGLVVALAAAIPAESMNGLLDWVCAPVASTSDSGVTDE